MLNTIVLMILIIAAVSDINTMEVSPWLFLGGITFCLFYRYMIEGREAVLFAALCAAGMFVLIVLMNIIIGHLMKSGSGFGGADALALSTIAAVHELDALWVFAISLVFCTVFLKWKKQDKEYPFIPFLLCGYGCYSLVLPLLA